jgi:predicted phage tail component-like protein
MGNFTFNGVSSLTHGLRVTKDYIITSTGNDVEVIAVPGRDGELIVSNKRLKSKPIELPCTIKSNKPLSEVAVDISNWLLVDGYQDLTLSWDPEFVYKASYIETFEIATIMKQFGTIKLNFLAQPVKYFKDSMQRQNLSNGLSLNGKGNVKAKPIIKMTGNGETVLTINGRKTKLKDVQGNIVLDMQSSQVYSGNLSAWNKVVRSPEFVMPFLDPGRNLISWTGNFTAEITPFWGVKA